MTWTTVRHSIGAHTRGLRRSAQNLTDRRLETVNAGPAAGLRLPRRLASAHYAEAPNELPVQEAIAEALRPGDVFFDIGANVGFFSLIASRIVGPTGTVVAFEPIPDIARQLESNARINGVTNIRVLNIAVADRDAEMILQTTAHPGGATLEGFGTPHDRTGAIQIQARTIDSLIAAGEIPIPSVIKVDVEGAEAAVLRGAGQTLSTRGPVVVYELDAETESEVSAKAEDVVQLLQATRYRVSQLPTSYGDTHVVRHFVARVD